MMLPRPPTLSKRNVHNTPLQHHLLACHHNTNGESKTRSIEKCTSSTQSPSEQRYHQASGCWQAQSALSKWVVFKRATALINQNRHQSYRDKNYSVKYLMLLKLWQKCLLTRFCVKRRNRLQLQVEKFQEVYLFLQRVDLEVRQTHHVRVLMSWRVFICK